MIECHCQRRGREGAWQGCAPLSSVSLQPLRRMEVDKQRKIESESNLCVVFQGGEDLGESPKLEHGVLVGVELVERLRFISLKRERKSRRADSPNVDSPIGGSVKPHGFSWWGRRRSTRPNAAATPSSGQGQRAHYLHTRLLRSVWSGQSRNIVF